MEEKGKGAPRVSSAHVQSVDYGPKGRHPLERYEPFSAWLRRHQKAEAPRKVAAELPKRTAVLVIHGIGAQKPYETLDQFARGLIRYFLDSNYVRQTRQILWRHHATNANTHEENWTQVVVRVKPEPESDNYIDLYEYYWAPVITGRVTATGSLKFLLMSALSPFHYLRDNLIVINEAQGASGSAKVKYAMYALAREFFRAFVFFLPVIPLVGGLYVLVATPTMDLLSPNASKLKTFLLGPLDWRRAVWLALFLVRLLLIGMSANFLIQEVRERLTRKRRAPKRGVYWPWMLAVLLLLLLVPPFYSIGVTMVSGIECFLRMGLRSRLVCVLVSMLFAALVTPLSGIARSAWERGTSCVRTTLWTIGKLLVLFGAVLLAVWLSTLEPGAVHRACVLHWLAFPAYLKWRLVFRFAVLVGLAYVIQQFLTTAIGCLAVYLGADALSTNYAARSQILEECTKALTNLLSGLGKDGKPEAQYDYDQVLIAAHSLGSVIAYDALNEMIGRHMADAPLPNLGKLKGLLTFGCPLNKVVYFFRTRTNSKTTVLSQALYALHPFRLRTPLPPEANPAVALPHPLPSQAPFAEDFRWLNAYSPFDLISGRMQFYWADDDVAVERGIMPWTAHLSYWENDQLYRLFASLL